MNWTVIVGKLVICKNCHIQFQVFAFNFKLLYSRNLNAVAQCKLDTFIFMQFKFSLCSHRSLFISNKVSDHIISYKQTAYYLNRQQFYGCCAE